MDKEIFVNYLNKYLHLLSLYLNKKNEEDLNIDNQELEFFINLSKRHSLTALFYKVISDLHINIPKQYYSKLEEYYFLNLRKHALFDNERKELFKYLDDNEIEYLPLKGIIIKNYYLDKETREFADNDILFGGKDEIVKKFFTDRKYEVEVFKKSNHDVYLKKPCYNFEMHRALFSDREDIPGYAVYFDNYLTKSPIKNGHEHYLTNEDFYIYFTAHSYKHFNNSGCGIRTLVDFYLYLKNNNLDFDYINQELKKIDLLDFSNKIIDLVNKAFNNQDLNKEELNALLYIASSGTYGTLENSVMKGVKKKGKFKYFMSRIFPPTSFYKTYYSWAYKSKVLIPVAWIIRAFRILFKNPKRATTELKMIAKSGVKEDKKK